MAKVIWAPAALPSWREVILGGYRIMYRLEGHAVWISAIVHGARQWRAEK